MRKPVPDKNSVYDFDEILDFIKWKYKINYCDYNRSLNHFDLWCKQKGYGKKDPDGLPRSKSKIWFDEYSVDPNGLKSAPKTESFWDWFLYDYDLQELRIFYFYVENDLVNNLSEHDQKFLTYIKEEFGPVIKVISYM